MKINPFLIAAAVMALSAVLFFVREIRCKLRADRARDLAFKFRTAQITEEEMKEFEKPTGAPHIPLDPEDQRRVDQLEKSWF